MTSSTQPNLDLRPMAGRRHTSGSSKGSNPQAHISAIDGLRAVAVVGVLAFHLSVLQGGFLGVDLFFVISGYVITRLIFRERASPEGFLLTRFWGRRVRRLLPAVLTVVIVVQLWIHFVNPPGLESAARGQAISSLFYGTNWFNIFAELDYWDAGAALSPLNHLWSLAIEEQFYIVWPLILLVLPRRWMVGVAATLGILVSAAIPFTFGSTWTLDRLYQGTDTRVMALLGGVLLACLLTKTTSNGDISDRISSIGGTRWLNGLSLIAVGATAWIWTTVSFDDGIFRGPIQMAGISEFVLVGCVALGRQTWLSSLLSKAPFLYVGRRSYALYLWHWPVIALVNESSFGLTGFSLGAVRTLLIIAFTLGSYNLIENKARFSRTSKNAFTSRVIISMIVAGTLAMVPASLSQRFFSDQASPSIDAGAASDPAYSPLPVPGGHKLLVVGDSWAHNLATGMADPQFKTSIVNSGIGGCGIANPDLYRKDTGQEYTPPIQCQTWATDWTQAMAAEKPDGIVLFVGNWDQKEANIGGQWVYPGDKAFDNLYSGRLDDALRVLSSGGVPVFLLTTVTLTGDPFRQHSIAMNQLLLDAAKRNPSVHLIDIGDFLCRKSEVEDCPKVRNDQPIYDATGHLAPYWQTKSAQWSLGQIYRVLTPATIPSPGVSPKE